MLRESTWRIVWNPSSSSVILLELGDLMDEEISLDAQWLTAVGVSDFAPTVELMARGNQAVRLDFGRRMPRASAAASWDRALANLSVAPFNEKGTLQLTPRDGVARLYQAVLLSSEHAPAYSDGITETVSHYSFRIQRITP